MSAKGGKPPRRINTKAAARGRSHAKVLAHRRRPLTTELEAAPTLYGIRYRNEPNASESRHLIWAVWGERAWLAEGDRAVPGADGEGQRQC